MVNGGGSMGLHIEGCDATPVVDYIRMYKFSGRTWIRTRNLICIRDLLYR